MQQRVGAEFLGADVAIAEAHDRDWRTCAARGRDVGCGVADHDGAAHQPARTRHRGAEMLGVRLALGHRVGADHGGEALGHAHRLKQHVGQIGALVGADGELGAECGQRIERIADAREGLGVARDVCPVAGDEFLGKLIEPLVLEVDAGERCGSLDQAPRALADERAHDVDLDPWQALQVHGLAQRARQIGRSVDQGAVEVENDGGVREFAAGHGMPPLEQMR